MKKHYVDGPFGQIHTRQWSSPKSENPPLICLSPSPFSGLAYETIAPILAAERPVVAMDYPGYGASTATPDDPTIEDFARCAGEVASAVSPDSPVDLMGFHTGCLVAVETALLFPERVNHSVLVDVPYFETGKRAELFAQMGGPTPIEPELSMLAQAWEFCVTKRLEFVSLQRSYATFIDHVSAGEGTNAAFRAAFSYPCEEKFAATTATTTVIATKAGLYEPSCAAAEVVPGASLVELPEISFAVLEKGADSVAAAANQALG